MSPPASTPSWPRWVAPAALAVLAVAVVRFVLERRAPEPGEGVCLRWLRMAALHPVRSWAALALSLWAARGPAPPTADPGTEEPEGL